MFAKFVGFFTLLLPTLLMAQLSVHRLTVSHTDTVQLNYLLYLPAEYEQGKWPLHIFLHGSGERGTNTELLKVHGPFRHIAAGEHYPMIVVAPQCPENEWWDRTQVFALLKHLRQNLRVDPDRIYLSGISMGGYATWEMACYYPQYIAAVVPICGGGLPILAGRTLTNMPVWAFHGQKDTVVPPHHSSEMVDQINKNGGDARLTLYPEAGHDAWTPTYQSAELLTWLLAQKKTR